MNKVIKIDQEASKRRAKIIKCQRKDNFTRIYNDCINDKNLSGEALAVLVYVMSKPEDWIVYVNDLCVRFKRSPNKIYALINELINSGYMQRYQPRNESGMVLPWVTEASDEPIFLKKLTDSPANDLPLTQDKKNITTLEPRALLPHINLPHAVKTGRGEMNTTKKEYTNKRNKQKNNNNKAVVSNKDKLEVEPNGSVVVSLMERIKHLAVSRVLVASWLKKHGLQYLLEKIDLTETQKPNRPEGFLNKAITQDWKPALLRQPESKQERLNELVYPSNDENVTWYNSLANEDKLKYLQMASFKNSIFEEHLKHHKVSVLNTAFSGHSLFKMMMSLLGRAK